MECLILVAENDGPTMMACITVMGALNRHVVRDSNEIAKKRIGESAAEAGRMKNLPACPSLAEGTNLSQAAWCDRDRLPRPKASSKRTIPEPPLWDRFCVHYF
jgi:hypothetical protein